MSRYAHKAEDGATVEYGYDRSPIPGYFYMVKEGGDIVEAGDTREFMLCSPESEHKRSGEIAERLEDYGVKEKHVNKISMDLPV